MTAGFKITDGGETSNFVKVTNQNQLVVGELDFTTTVQNDIDIVDTAFNFFKPQAGKIFIITQILVNATRSASVNGTVVEIYQASSASSTTVDEQTFKLDIARQQVIALSGLNIRIPQGKFLNVKADSVVVLVTIGGYFAPA